MRRLLAFVCVIVFVDTLFYAAITPILPELSDKYGLSKTSAGVLAAAYPAGTFVGALPGGWMAARIGVRPTVLFGLGLMVVSSIGFAFADNIVVLDVSRFVQGVGGAASWAGALGWMIGAAPRDRRGQYIGTALAAAVAGRAVRARARRRGRRARAGARVRRRRGRRARPDGVLAADGGPGAGGRLAPADADRLAQATAAWRPACG